MTIKLELSLSYETACSSSAHWLSEGGGHSSTVLTKKTSSAEMCEEFLSKLSKNNAFN